VLLSFLLVYILLFYFILSNCGSSLSQFQAMLLVFKFYTFLITVCTTVSHIKSYTYIQKSLVNTVYYVNIMEMCVLYIVFNCILCKCVYCVYFGVCVCVWCVCA